MKKSQTRRNMLTALWNTAGSVSWLYNIKAYAKKEKLVDELDSSEKIKKFLHICYKADYVLFIIFATICAYGAGRALGKAFEPEPIEENEQEEVTE